MTSPERGEIENPGSAIDLSGVFPVFQPSTEIEEYYADKLSSMSDPENYMNANKKRYEWITGVIMERRGVDLDRATKIFLDNERLMYEDGKKNVLKVKELIEAHWEEVISNVTKKLSKFLPDWSAGTVKINMAVLERADYRHPTNGLVEADLERIARSSDPLENLAEGLAHELFHEWFNIRQIDGENDGEASLSKARSIVLARTINEGLAVLVSEQPLSAHYERQKKVYADVIPESFSYVSECLQTEDLEEVRTRLDEGLKNMGPFYVVGYEVAKAVLEKVGLMEFRRLVAESKENPNVIFDIYRDLVVENPKLESLPRI